MNLIRSWWVQMVERWRRIRISAYMVCNVAGDFDQMCGSCWFSTDTALSAAELQQLVREYPPAAAAQRFWKGEPA